MEERRPTGPVRMCVICRNRFPKGELERHVVERTDLGAVRLSPDGEQTRPGRGYYVCGDPKCRERFGHFKGFGKKS